MITGPQGYHQPDLELTTIMSGNISPLVRHPAFPDTANKMGTNGVALYSILIDSAKLAFPYKLGSVSGSAAGDSNGPSVQGNRRASMSMPNGGEHACQAGSGA
jgi:hypothetical protein